MNHSCYDESFIVKQCGYNNIPIFNTAINEQKWNNCMKINHILECLKQIETDYILILDGRDTLIVNDLDATFIEKYLSYKIPIVYNATPIPYPNTVIEPLQELLKISGTHKFLNAGICVGTKEALVEFYKQAKIINDKIYNKYNKYKWEVPKLLYLNGKLWCVDGMHRIYGAFKGKIEAVICEIIECSEKEAIKLFLGQGIDRRKMSQVDYYRAAIEYGDENYIQLKEICNNHNVAVKGDPIENQVGIFTPIKDGIKSIRKNGTELLDKIITIITDLQWNGYADTYNGKAYTAKIIKVL